VIKRLRAAVYLISTVFEKLISKISGMGLHVTVCGDVRHLIETTHNSDWGAVHPWIGLQLSDRSVLAASFAAARIAILVLAPKAVEFRGSSVKMQIGNP